MNTINVYIGGNDQICTYINASIEIVNNQIYLILPAMEVDTILQSIKELQTHVRNETIYGWGK